MHATYTALTTALTPIAPGLELTLTIAQSLPGFGCFLKSGNNHLLCILDIMTAASGGQGLFGFYVGVLTFAVFYLAAGGDIRPPSTILVLMSGALFPLLPTQYARIGLGLGVVGLGAAIMTVLKVYYMEAGGRL